MLNIYCFLARTCAGTSVALLLRTLTLGNIADLWFYVFYIWMQTQFNIDIRSLNIVTCKTIAYFSYSSLSLTIFNFIVQYLNVQTLISTVVTIRVGRIFGWFSIIRVFFSKYSGSRVLGYSSTIIVTITQILSHFLQLSSCTISSHSCTCIRFFL